MAKIDNTYVVFYETNTKIVQGKGLWGEEDTDGVCQIKGLQVNFASTVTTYMTDTYQDALDYITNNNLIIPEE